MVLSDRDILSAIQTGDIKIDPFTNDHLNPGSYSFTLNNVIFIPKWPKIIDARNPKIDYEKVVIGQPGYELLPGAFVLAQTRERVTVSQSIACILDARTTLARIGLNVLQGSTFIEPGQTDSHETLEISNIGESSIKIYPGMKIVKGIFIRLSQVPSRNYAEMGKYRKQKEAKVVLENR